MPEMANESVITSYNQLYLLRLCADRLGVGELFGLGKEVIGMAAESGTTTSNLKQVIFNFNEAIKE